MTTKPQRVADLSFRDTLDSLARDGDLVADSCLPTASIVLSRSSRIASGRLGDRQSGASGSKTRARASRSKPPPRCCLPRKAAASSASPAIPRAQMDARDRPEHQPGEIEGKGAGRARDRCGQRELEQQRAELLDRVAALEAEAKQIRNEADAIGMASAPKSKRRSARSSRSPRPMTSSSTKRPIVSFQPCRRKSLLTSCGRARHRKRTDQRDRARLLGRHDIAGMAPATQVRSRRPARQWMDQRRRAGMARSAVSQLE